jgi:hypothetical protein
LFPQKWGALELGGMIVLIRDEMVDTFGDDGDIPVQKFPAVLRQ